MKGEIKCKLSIITINYNNREGLCKTILSVSKQHFENCEYIIIDGGSTDGSVDLIKHYSDHIGYWVSEPDRGIYHAMNKGILQSKGEYIIFMNSGDEFAGNNVLDKMFSSTENASLIYGDYILKQHIGTKEYSTFLSSPVSPDLFTFYKGTICHQASFINRELFHKYGLYDERLKIVADWKLFLQAFGISNERSIYKKVTVAIVDDAGISSTDFPAYRAERELVLKEMISSSTLKLLKEYDTTLSRRKIINKYWLSKMFYLLASKGAVLLSRGIEKTGWR